MQAHGREGCLKLDTHKMYKRTRSNSNKHNAHTQRHNGGQNKRKTNAHCLPDTRAHALSLSRTHAHTHSLTDPRARTRAHTHAHTHMHTHCHTPLRDMRAALSHATSADWVQDTSVWHCVVTACTSSTLRLVILLCVSNCILLCVSQCLCC